MGSNTDFEQLEGWFNPHLEYDLDDLVQFADTVRMISGRSALILEGEIGMIRKMLIAAVGSKWAEYEARDLRGDWSNLWTPAGDPREVTERAIKPLKIASRHLTEVQVTVSKLPRTLQRHLDPVINPGRAKANPGFNLDKGGW